MYKLSKYGFSESALKWIENFLTHRSQYVKIGNCLSEEQRVVSGVPQGTVLGPLLFLCFSSDINNIVNHTHLSMYADDTKIFRKNMNLHDCTLLQSDLDKIFTWATLWQLRLNSEKTKHLRIGNCKYDFTFSLDGVDIDKVDSICDIGVNIQSNLKFTKHCNALARNGHFNIRNIFNTFKGHTANFYVKMYTTYVRPILESSSPVWSPYLICNIDKLETVQRRFTKRLPGLANFSYETRLSMLNLESLKSRRIKADLLLYFKVSNNLTCINISNCVRPYESSRGHNKHLYHFYSRTEARKNFWANRIVRFWNNLGSDIVNSRSVKDFKHKLRNVLL